MKDSSSVRDSILEVIEKNPGLHFREIQRRTGTAVGQIEYHLYQLEKMDKVVIKEDGKLKRYFSTTKGDATERRVIYYLRNNLTRNIITMLVEEESIELDRILKSKRGKYDRIKKYVEGLERDRIIAIEKDNGSEYVRLRDQKLVLDTLKKFKESFMDSMASNLLAMLE